MDALAGFGALSVAAMLLFYAPEERSPRLGAGVRGGQRPTVGGSSVTLGGLLKHLAFVEDATFARKLLGQAPGPPWDAVDWAAEDSPEQLYALWQDAVARSRLLVTETLADGGLDRPGRFTTPSGESPSLRRILIDLVEAYARHVGHADLIRESVDGLIGEDPTDRPFPYRHAPP
jgi:hypothetical protein